jgi:hypothetical protein
LEAKSTVELTAALLAVVAATDFLDLEAWVAILDQT